jgi:hypothetical protein
MARLIEQLTDAKIRTIVNDGPHADGRGVIPENTSRRSIVDFQVHVEQADTRRRPRLSRRCVADERTSSSGRKTRAGSKRHRPHRARLERPLVTGTRECRMIWKPVLD